MDDTPAPALLRRQNAATLGYTDHVLRRKVDAGELTRMRPGSFVSSVDLEGTEAEVRHRLLIDATLRVCSEDAVVSHVSAAILHGLPVWGTELSRVHVSRPRTNAGHITAGLHSHPAPLDPDEIVVIGGHRVTSLARTVIDLARTVPFEQAVVTADAALRLPGPGAQRLLEALTRAKGRHGCCRARQVVAFADGRSESVGESRSRVIMHRHGLPTPTLQHVVRDRDGRQIARTDFCFEQGRVVGEFDGKAKYVRYLRLGESPGDAVFREKRREDAIRAEDYDMVRWCWVDLDHPHEWIERLRRSLAARSG